MQEALPFEFDNYEVTTAVVDGEPQFFANEVAIALGYKDYRHAIRTHCRKVSPSPVPIRDKRGQIQHPNLIPESDVYRLIFRSRLPSAERFMDWVSEEVLPNLRRTGHHALEGSALDQVAQQRTLDLEDVCRDLKGGPAPTNPDSKLLHALNIAADAAGLPAQYSGNKVTRFAALVLAGAYRSQKRDQVRVDRFIKKLTEPSDI